MLFRFVSVLLKLKVTNFYSLILFFICLFCIFFIFFFKFIIIDNTIFFYYQDILPLNCGFLLVFLVETNFILI